MIILLLINLNNQQSYAPRQTVFSECTSFFSKQQEKTGKKSEGYQIFQKSLLIRPAQRYLRIAKENKAFGNGTDMFKINQV